jgi:hypothetical protein
MKTSNKILIGFAAALILIPVLGMVIVSATQYKMGDYKDPAYNFNNQKNGLSSITINKSFNGINIVDGQLSALSIHHEKSNDYGLRIDGVDTKDVKWSIDEQGILQVSYIGKEKIIGRNFFIQVFSPKLKSVKASFVEFLVVSAPEDSLEMDIAHTKAISFTRPYPQDTAKVKSEPYIKYLKLTLNNSTFNDNNNYDNLDLSLSGKSTVSFSNDEYNKKAIGKIGNLKINTLDSAKVNFENIAIGKCSGSFSDQTKVQMPAVNLNQMYKK